MSAPTRPAREPLRCPSWGRQPTTLNSAVRPSENVTVVFGLAPAGGPWSGSGPAGPLSSSGFWRGTGPWPGLAAVATTWLLVRIKPSADRMMPEPSSWARPRLVSSMTTLGTTFAAICSTLPVGAFAAGIPGVAPPRKRPVGNGCELSAMLDHRGGRTADTGRHHRDRHRTDGQCACARTLSRRAHRRWWPAGGRTTLTAGEGTVGLPVLRLLLAVTPVIALRIGLLLSRAGMPCGPTLIGHGTVSVLLRRWRIPRVIRHVARSLFSLSGRFRLTELLDYYLACVV